MAQLKTVKEIVIALSGNTAVCRLTGASPQSVTNWRSANRIPPKYFLICTKQLAARKLTAPASLWGIIDPDE